MEGLVYELEHAQKHAWREQRLTRGTLLCQTPAKPVTEYDELENRSASFTRADHSAYVVRLHSDLRATPGGAAAGPYRTFGRVWIRSAEPC